MPDAYPRYSIPFTVLTDLSARVILRRRLNFRAHALRMIASLPQEPLVVGSENIPGRGTAVITVNHYHRPGFFIPWLAAAISAQVEEEIQWVMTGAWTFPHSLLAPLLERTSRKLFRCVAEVYGFHTMPPMPPRLQDAEESAAAVSRLLRSARRNPHAVFGLTPEGGGSLDGSLIKPPDGSGRIMLAFAQIGACFHPAGLFESQGRLVICFGKPYRLEVSETGRTATDLRARTIVMERIAECLPPQLRGVFGKPA